MRIRHSQFGRRRRYRMTKGNYTLTFGIITPHRGWQCAQRSSWSRGSKQYTTVWNWRRGRRRGWRRMLSHKSISQTPHPLFARFQKSVTGRLEREQHVPRHRIYRTHCVWLGSWGLSDCYVDDTQPAQEDTAQNQPWTLRQNHHHCGLLQVQRCNRILFGRMAWWFGKQFWSTRRSCLHILPRSNAVDVDIVAVSTRGTFRTIYCRRCQI